MDAFAVCTKKYLNRRRFNDFLDGFLPLRPSVMRYGNWLKYLGYYPSEDCWKFLWVNGKVLHISPMNFSDQYTMSFHPQETQSYSITGLDHLVYEITQPFGENGDFLRNSIVEEDLRDPRVASHRVKSEKEVLDAVERLLHRYYQSLLPNTVLRGLMDSLSLGESPYHVIQKKIESLSLAAGDHDMK